MDFYYWPPALQWGLPSFDIGSLHVLSYIKFSGASITLHPTKRSWLPKEGKVLPCLIASDGKVIEKPHKIIEYLREQGIDPDNNIDDAAKNKMLPLESLILEKLRPAVTAAFWCDHMNYRDVVRSTYANACNYPLNFTIPNKIQHREERFLREFKSLAEDDFKGLDKLQPDAFYVLNLLCEFLCDKDYLFGNSPSSLDALLFSILAPTLKISLTNNKLQNHLNGCTHICQYVSRILQRFFYEELQVKPNQNDATDEYDWKYDWFFPVSVAAVAMFSYAANAGLLHTRAG